MKELDVVVYGATGFTGRQAARELCKHAPQGMRIGIAGRDAARLKRVCDGLPREVISIVADSTDSRSIRSMTERTRVLLTTAGPFARYGTPVLEACVVSKTHYVDITGETPWAREMIELFHDKAAADGTKIVPFCGYDSVPSDIGALLAVQALRERGEATQSIEAFHVAKGGFNGGTLATMMTMADPKTQAIFADPFALCPQYVPPEDVARASRDPRTIFKHKETGRWLAPFFMGPTNTRVVRRSALLAAQVNESYGERFHYQEYWKAGSRFEAMAMFGGIASLFKLADYDVGRKLLQSLGPKPGEGPSEHAMDTGFYKAEHLAHGVNGGRAHAEISGQGDPGNRATVLFLVEAALALALDFDRLPKGGGVLTPASALGMPYAERLKHRNVKCDVRVD